MAIENYYQTIEKVTFTKTSDGRGGNTYAEDVAIEFQGLINDANGREILMAEKLGLDINSKLYTSINNPLSIDEIVKNVDDVLYRVVSNNKNTVHRNHHFKILLRRISLDEV
jgi:hypothetical protein